MTCGRTALHVIESDRADPYRPRQSAEGQWRPTCMAAFIAALHTTVDALSVRSDQAIPERFAAALSFPGFLALKTHP